MMNCPRLPVASRNLGHLLVVHKKPKSLWDLGYFKDVPKWSPGSLPKRSNILTLPPTDKAPQTDSHSQEDHFMVDSDIAFKKPGK